MLDEAAPPPEDPGGLRALARLPIAEARARATLIDKFRHRLVGARTHSHGASGESARQLHPGSGPGQAPALETGVVAAGAIMSRPPLPEEDEEARRPRRGPIPKHVPRMEVEIAPGEDACARCGARPRRLSEDVIRPLADQFGMMRSGHRWTPAWPLMRSRSALRATH